LQRFVTDVTDGFLHKYDILYFTDMGTYSLPYGENRGDNLPMRDSGRQLADGESFSDVS